MSIKYFGDYDSGMQLSPKYTLADLCQTSTGLPNLPLASQTSEIANLKWLARTLEALETDIGPFTILSGFRTPEVQQALADAGEPVAVRKSFHEAGMAVDITPTLASGVGNQEFYGKLAAAVGTDEQPGPWYGKWSEIAYKPSQNSIHLALATNTKQNVFMALNSAGTYARLTAEEVADYAKPYLQAIEEAASTAIAAVSTPVGMGTIGIVMAGILLYFFVFKPTPKAARA